MKIAIMQPYFFPYLGYWQLLNVVDKYVIYDDVNYIKGGWINRNNVLLNGKKHLITLPLDKASPFLLINQVRTTSDRKMKEKLLKTIEYAYKKAPFYKEIYPIVFQIIMEESYLLSNTLENQFKLISNYLEIKTELILSSKIKKNNELRGQDKVIHICKILGGTEYINAIGGQELYSRQSFAQNGIDLYFLKSTSQAYQQFKNKFVSDLSIIDVLMFNGKEEIKNMLGQYELL